MHKTKHILSGLESRDYAREKVENYAISMSPFEPHNICRDNDSEIIKSTLHTFSYKGKKMELIKKLNKISQANVKDSVKKQIDCKDKSKIKPNNGKRWDSKASKFVNIN